MKIGYRKPSIKRSVSSRTTGRITRAAKKAVTPMYGQKGTGILKDPKKAAYNAVYNKTTTPVHQEGSKRPARASATNAPSVKKITWQTISREEAERRNATATTLGTLGILLFAISLLLLLLVGTPWGWIPLFVGFVLVVIASSNHSTVQSQRNMAKDASGQLLKISEESAAIVNSTVKPEVFFQRYDLLVEALKSLSEIEHLIDFVGMVPAENLKEVLLKRERETSVFLKRAYEKEATDALALKTAKGRQNRLVRFFETLEPYHKYLTKSNKEYLEKLKSYNPF